MKGRGSSVLAITGIVVGLGLLVNSLATLALAQGGATQPIPCDKHRASTATAPCYDNFVDCLDQPSQWCADTIGNFRDHNYMWPAQCVPTSNQTNCPSASELCYGDVDCEWNPMMGICVPVPGSERNLIRRNMRYTVAC